MNPRLKATVTLLALGSLAACSGSGDDGNAAAPPAPSSPSDPSAADAAVGAGTGGGGAIGTFLATLGGDSGSTAPPSGQTGSGDEGTGSGTPADDGTSPTPGGDGIGEPGEPTTTGGDDVAAIAGLYDFTFDNEGTEDITYIEIRADGTLREYDFLGDENASVNGEFENCHDLVEGVIESRGAGQYLVNLESVTTDDGNGFIADITLTEAGLRLIVTSAGGTVDMIAPVVTGLSTADFNLCA